MVYLLNYTGNISQNHIEHDNASYHQLCRKCLIISNSLAMLTRSKITINATELLQKMKRIFPKIDFNFLMVCLQWKGKHAKLQRISKEKES
ncbi:hypothetical protein T11_15300 [Trichinella zimbabwensis]|uniref:Uncharacterized protein n=1 Tax=Trichinella zimbabwensis TaxID=268475 RepID=A0A0V1HI08_9BILA|nr:hypothetical protein T11_15300 [Trichinella zimbabwensis]